MEKILNKVVLNSITELLYKDYELFERNVHERAIAFRLGHYLQNNLKLEKSDNENFIVDAEFNKFKNDVKEVYKECKNNCRNDECFIKKNNLSELKLEYGKNKEASTLKEFVEKVSETKSMIPDLIIHKRNEINEDNILAIEIKIKDKKMKMH